MSYRRHLPVVALLCAAVLGTAAPQQMAVSPSPRPSSAADPATPTATNKPRPVASMLGVRTYAEPLSGRLSARSLIPVCDLVPIRPRLRRRRLRAMRLKEAAKYWTAQRMANARPLNALRAQTLRPQTCDAGRRVTPLGTAPCSAEPAS